MNQDLQIWHVVAAIALLSFSWPAMSQDALANDAIAASPQETQPLQAGDTAPGFEVRTVDDEPFVFDPQALEGNTVIITFRGGWCPYCNMHLSELHTVIPDIKALGIDVFFLSGDRPEILYSNLKRETQESIANLDYRILSDANAQASIAFGTAFKESVESITRRGASGDIGGSSMELHGVVSVPSVFAINQQGTIVFAHSNPDFKVRIPVDELMRVARELADAE